MPLICRGGPVCPPSCIIMVSLGRHAGLPLRLNESAVVSKNAILDKWKHLVCVVVCSRDSSFHPEWQNGIWLWPEVLERLFFFFAAHVLRCDSEERLELFGEIAG